jgi:hypothetical protein
MVKFFTILFFVTGICTAAIAQTKSNVEFGANIGYNISYINETGYGDLNSPTVGGINLGVSADFKISAMWSIKVKGIYDQKGWAGGYFIDKAGETINNPIFQLNYITVPVMATWHFGRTKNWYLNFGPYVGFLLNANETFTNTDVKSTFNNTDAGIALGIGVKFPISDKVRLFIEDDGQVGVINIFKNGTNGVMVENVRSGLNIGINFPLD